MVKRDNVISFDNSANGLRQEKLGVGNRRMVDACREKVTTTLPKLMLDLFEKLDDALFQQTEKSESNAAQNDFFEAMREIRKHRDGIVKDFNQAVLARYNSFWEGKLPKAPDAPAGDGEFGEEGLSLVDQADLEESLAVTNIISLGENRYHRELFALNTRFAHLLGMEEISNSQNPLGPAAICNHFNESLVRVELAIPVKLLVYKLFELHVVRYVGALYDDLNSLLRDGGVLPKLPQKLRRNPVSPAVSQSETPHEGEPDYEENESQYTEEAGGPSAEAFFSSLQNLLRQQRGGMPAHYASLPVVGSQELLGALSSLQQTAVEEMPLTAEQAHEQIVSLRTGLRTQLNIQPGERADRRIGQSEEDIIDVISMLFDFILDDRDLPDAMKALLSRLQIPMLKVAILDKRFFSQKNHPARRLLNLLAQSAMGWTDDGDRSAGSLYGRIEQVVSRIVSEFDDNVELFEELTDNFANFQTREEQGAAIVEERTQQVSRGQEQMKVAKLRVAEEINGRVARHPGLPEAVKTFLADGWKDVLLLGLLREGEDSDIWQDSLALMDRLLWSVMPKTEASERQALLAAIPELLRQLREGLNNISYDQHKMARLFKDLQMAHIQCLRGAQPAPAAKADKPESDARSESGIATGQDSMEAANEETGSASEEILIEAPLTADIEGEEHEEDEYSAQALTLPVGGWIDWEQDDGTELRAKLSWRSEVTNTCIFVNRKGVKVAEMGINGLAGLLRSGRARVLQDVQSPIMERALGAMMDALKQPAPAAQ